jgi:hypothetical protein
VKVRTRVQKGAGSKKAARRRFNGHELVAEVLDDVKFKDGEKVTDDEATTTLEAHRTKTGLPDLRLLPDAPGVVCPPALPPDGSVAA